MGERGDEGQRAFKFPPQRAARRSSRTSLACPMPRPHCSNAKMGSSHVRRGCVDHRSRPIHLSAPRRVAACTPPSIAAARVSEWGALDDQSAGAARAVLYPIPIARPVAGYSAGTRLGHSNDDSSSGPGRGLAIRDMRQVTDARKGSLTCLPGRVGFATKESTYGVRAVPRAPKEGRQMRRQSWVVK